jgi:hypothetical protein
MIEPTMDYHRRLARQRRDGMVNELNKRSFACCANCLTWYPTPNGFAVQTVARTEFVCSTPCAEQLIERRESAQSKPRATEAG